MQCWLLEFVVFDADAVVCEGVGSVSGWVILEFVVFDADAVVCDGVCSVEIDLVGNGRNAEMGPVEIVWDDNVSICIEDVLCPSTGGFHQSHPNHFPRQKMNVYWM